jgi:hypothetical protein
MASTGIGGQPGRGTDVLRGKDVPVVPGTATRTRPLTRRPARAQTQGCEQVPAGRTGLAARIPPPARIAGEADRGRLQRRRVQVGPRPPDPQGRGGLGQGQLSPLPEQRRPGTDRGPLAVPGREPWVTGPLGKRRAERGAPVPQRPPPTAPTTPRPATSARGLSSVRSAPRRSGGSRSRPCPAHHVRAAGQARVPDDTHPPERGGQHHRLLGVRVHPDPVRRPHSHIFPTGDYVGKAIPARRVRRGFPARSW